MKHRPNRDTENIAVTVSEDLLLMSGAMYHKCTSLYFEFLKTKQVFLSVCQIWKLLWLNLFNTWQKKTFDIWLLASAGESRIAIHSQTKWSAPAPIGCDGNMTHGWDTLIYTPLTWVGVKDAGAVIVYHPFTFRSSSEEHCSTSVEFERVTEVKTYQKKNRCYIVTNFHVSIRYLPAAWSVLHMCNSQQR